MDKIFKSMSTFIGTREAEQCRSHHQKMEKKYESFFRILESLRLEFYGTCDVERVRDDLESNEFFHYDPLINEKEIE